MEKSKQLEKIIDTLESLNDEISGVFDQLHHDYEGAKDIVNEIENYDDFAILKRSLFNADSFEQVRRLVDSYEKELVRAHDGDTKWKRVLDLRNDMMKAIDDVIELVGSYATTSRQLVKQASKDGMSAEWISVTINANEKTNYIRFLQLVTKYISEHLLNKEDKVYDWTLKVKAHLEVI